MTCDCNGFTLTSDTPDLNVKHQWAFSTARYVFCILTALGVKTVCLLVYELVRRQRELDVRLLSKVNRHKVMIYAVALAVLYLGEQSLYADDFLLVLVAYLIAKYPDIGNGVNLTCGTGLACTYVEGYLDHVIPSDGQDFKGFLGNIEEFEGSHGVIFPVKKLFIIMTKSMCCPPDLKEFNDKSGRTDLPWIEACPGLSAVEKDVAGVKKRKYGNSAYKINRPGQWPVYIAAECTGSLHTFYKVVKNSNLLSELSDVCIEDVVTDFVTMLRRVVPKSPELKDKCELIYFDDTKGLNLANVLLDRIKVLEPKFEEIILRRV